MLVAGFIRKKPVELVTCETVDVEVPAHAEIVLDRKNPIYHTTVVGRLPMEDCHMAAAIETLFLPVMKKQLPVDETTLRYVDVNDVLPDPEAEPNPDEPVRAARQLVQAPCM